MDLILNYFPNLTSQQQDLLKNLKQLYSYWNERINVISRKDIEMLYLHHVLHSLSIAAFFQFDSGNQVVDVGTGGGFPGIPLAIVFPDVQFHLVDSIGKKIKVVQEVYTTLGLKNVTCEQIRVENLKKGRFHFAVSRAVTAFPDFINMTQNCISKKHSGELSNGIIYLKGGDFSEEIKPFAKKVLIFPISDVFKEAYFREKKIIYLPVS